MYEKFVYVYIYVCIQVYWYNHPCNKNSFVNMDRNLKVSMDVNKIKICLNICFVYPSLDGQFSCYKSVKLDGNWRSWNFIFSGNKKNKLVSHSGAQIQYFKQALCDLIVWRWLQIKHINYCWKFAMYINHKMTQYNETHFCLL